MKDRKYFIDIILEKEETKVWQYSVLLLAQLFNEERSGKLCLPEV